MSAVSKDENSDTIGKNAVGSTTKTDKTIEKNEQSNHRDEEMCLEKFFIWELENFDPEDLLKTPRDFNRLPFHIVRGFDRYNNMYHEAIMECRLWDNPFHATFLLEIRRNPTIPSPILRIECYCLYNDDETTRHPTHTVRGKLSKIVFCADLVVMVTAFVPTFKKLWINFDESLSNNFLIKSQLEWIKAHKNVLEHFSDVFKVMFSHRFKETEENHMEITDFDPKVVRKMIEFTESNDVTNFNFDGREEDIFKIAHKYQIENLMEFAIFEMVFTTTKENHSDRLKLTELYDLEDFKKWLNNL